MSRPQYFHEFVSLVLIVFEMVSLDDMYVR